MAHPVLFTEYFCFQTVFLYKTNTYFTGLINRYISQNVRLKGAHQPAEEALAPGIPFETSLLAWLAAPGGGGNQPPRATGSLPS